MAAAIAVGLANRGLARGWFTTLNVSLVVAILRVYPGSERLYLPQGMPPKPPYERASGFLSQGNLAATLGRLGWTTSTPATSPNNLAEFPDGAGFSRGSILILAGLEKTFRIW